MPEEEVVIAANETVAANSALGAVFATLGIFSIVFAIAWYILQAVAYWKIFTKAGKPGWHSIIPILNNWDEIDLSWNRTMAWVFTCCLILGSVLYSAGTTVTSDGQTITTTVGIIGSVISLACVVIGLINEYKLAKAFGKGFGFFLGLVFLNPIFKLILGFGDAQYQGPQG